MNQVRIFISYSNEDRDLAGEIRRCIEKNEQFRCFLAHDDIESGSDWEKAIISNLSECDAVLPIQTENFRHSPWCQQEIGMALQLGKVIIPLLPDEKRDEPKGFHAKYQGFPVKTKDVKESIAKLLQSEIFRAMADVSRRITTKTSDFERLLIEGPPIKIKAEIIRVRAKLLRHVVDKYLLLEHKNWEDFWQAHLEMMRFANDIFILADLIAKFEHDYAWSEFIKTLIELHKINDDQDRYGRNGWINNLFYSIFLIIGATAQYHGYLKGLKMLLSLKKINRDRLENILDWNIQASYIAAKNEAGESGWSVPRFKYTLDLVEGDDFPIKLKNFSDYIVDFDLNCFIYSVKFTSDIGYWYPCSMYYFDYRTPQFIKLIIQDSEYRQSWAQTLFDMSGEEFLKFIKNHVLPAYNHLLRQSTGYVSDLPFRPFRENAN